MINWITHAERKFPLKHSKNFERLLSKVTALTAHPQNRLQGSLYATSLENPLMFRNYAKLMAVVLVVVISSASTLLAQYTACISTGFTVDNPSAPTYGEVANDGTYSANFQIEYTNTCGNGYFSNCNLCKYKYITQEPSTDKLYEESTSLPGSQPCGTEASYKSTFTASGLVPGGAAYICYVEFSKYRQDLGTCPNLGGSKITVSVAFSQ